MSQVTPCLLQPEQRILHPFLGIGIVKDTEYIEDIGWVAGVLWERTGRVDDHLANSLANQLVKDGEA
jgi:hypothetical protein